MTVADLIAELSKYPPAALVVMADLSSLTDIGGSGWAKREWGGLMDKREWQWTGDSLRISPEHEDVVALHPVVVFG